MLLQYVCCIEFLLWFKYGCIKLVEIDCDWQVVVVVELFECWWCIVQVVCYVVVYYEMWCGCVVIGVVVLVFVYVLFEFCIGYYECFVLVFEFD